MHPTRTGSYSRFARNNALHLLCDSHIVPFWYYVPVPPKIRDLLRALKAAGFTERGGKGSHRNLKHPSGIRITISGAPGSDAKPYQEKAVKAALEQVPE